ncbi:hypothetical protein M422DRAFT_253496 [Sphaerobolus stellatus SS14]|uniref:Unplaced genomic scaffold SPHSTscaffold_49, whole genome shotgun sequence n=1 Tax=Sphaerobolus stellatus (strain SS14) TaxID=990650 RepID=A0A0C9VXV8_SPHS4|nr:hypothetical protein M422DRAFT_253496 [Sphaerobolus stellatus SS14]
MRFQLSTLLSISVLAFPKMLVAVPAPLPGILVTYDDATTAHFPYNQCVNLQNAAGSDLSVALFGDLVICDINTEFDCAGDVTRIPISFPENVPIPNLLHVPGTVFKSGSCFPIS